MLTLLRLKCNWAKMARGCVATQNNILFQFKSIYFHRKILKVVQSIRRGAKVQKKNLGLIPILCIM